MVGPSGLFPSPSRRGFLVEPVCSFTYGFWSPSSMCTWTPCLTYSKSPRPTCKRRVKLLYKGLCCAIGSKSKNIVIFALCFGFEWFSHPITLLYSFFDSEFSLGHLR